MRWCLFIGAQSKNGKKKEGATRKEEVCVGGSSPLIPDVWNCGAFL